MLTLFLIISALGLGFTLGLIMAGCLTSGKVADMEEQIWLLHNARAQDDAP